MKTFNKTIAITALGVVGMIGFNSKVSAQSYEETMEYKPMGESVQTISSSSGYASGYNTQVKPMGMNDPGAPKTRQQVINELVEARKNGLVDISDNDYPQKWVEYQNHLAYGTAYHK